jgi:hypothetical protein
MTVMNSGDNARLDIFVSLTLPDLVVTAKKNTQMITTHVTVPWQVVAVQMPMHVVVRKHLQPIHMVHVFTYLGLACRASQIV